MMMYFKVEMGRELWRVHTRRSRNSLYYFVIKGAVILVISKLCEDQDVSNNHLKKNHSRRIFDDDGRNFRGRPLILLAA